jgi:hypothetical protein
LILDHDISILVDIYPEVDIAYPAQRIIDKDDIASGVVPAKSESAGGVLDLRRKPQDNGIVAMANRVRLEAAGVVLQFIIWLHVVRLVLANNIMGVLLS